MKVLSQIFQSKNQQESMNYVVSRQILSIVQGTAFCLCMHNSLESFQDRKFDHHQLEWGNGGSFLLYGGGGGGGVG